MTPLEPLDHCRACGFDADGWDDGDTITTLGALAPLAAYWCEPLGRELLNERPRPDVWSAAEYLDHTRETLFGMRFLVDSALDDPDRDLGPAIEPGPPGSPRTLDPEATMAGLGEEARQLAHRLRTIEPERWDDAVVLGGRRHTVRWASRHAIHDAWHHLVDVASIGATLGRALPAQSGTIARINTSGGGVPKIAVAETRLSRRGLDGDQQDDRRHHGRPWQALSLWSSEVIEALVAEGHPIAAGSAGENLTLSGLDWSSLHPGALLIIGDATCRLTAPAIPCAKNNRWFADGDSQRIRHERHPGWSRWYAEVLGPGEVATGDRLRLAPPPLL